MRRKLDILRPYVCTLTAILAGLIWFWVAWEFTQKDLLEIIVVYVAFLMLPAYLLPYVIIDDIL
jgi:hypothetical protein